jgi:hypothetical protein
MAIGTLRVAVDRKLTDAVAMLRNFASATGLVSTT